MLVCCFITGCSSRVDGWRINKMVKVCKDHGGVDFYNNIYNIAYCNDGSPYTIHYLPTIKQ